MAYAIHRQDRGRVGPARRRKSRGGDTRVFRRLPGDAGGDRGRERAYLQEQRWREFRGHSVSQRQRGRHGGDLASGAARAARLDLKRRTAGRKAMLNMHHALIGALLTILVTPALAQDGVWSVKQPLSAPRNEVQLAAVNGELYVIGGAIGGNAVPEIDEYDPA